MRSIVVAATAAALALGLCAGAGYSRSATFSFQQVATGLNKPVDVASAPGDPSTVYVVEQPGTFVMVSNGTPEGTFLDIHDRVRRGGVQGLHEVVVHPG